MCGLVRKSAIKPLFAGYSVFLYKFRWWSSLVPRNSASEEMVNVTTYNISGMKEGNLHFLVKRMSSAFDGCKPSPLRLAHLDKVTSALCIRSEIV